MGAVRRHRQGAGAHPPLRAGQQRQQNRDQGRAALAKAFRQEGLDGSEKMLEAALKPLKQASIDDLYVAVGNSNLSPREVVFGRLSGTAAGAARAAHAAVAAPAQPPANGGSGLPITGLVPGMAISYAGCCHPLPGDPIVGIVTTGKGVTIHTQECHTLESFSATPERFIDVDWDPTVPADRQGRGAYRAHQRVADNAPGAIANVTNAISRQDGDIVNLRIVNRQAGFLRNAGGCGGARPAATDRT